MIPTFPIGGKLRFMAERSHRFTQNVHGRYYVDTTCVHCELCHGTAPDHFTKTSDGEGFVFQQPRTASEEKLCHEALRECPVNAIGDDGLNP